jgi:anti-sigma B factor antagonist
MTIEIANEQDKLIVKLSGRLDTITSPRLEAELNAVDALIREVVFDLSQLVYLSSSGLRVIMTLHRKLSGAVKITIRNATKPVMDVFEITGFSDILAFE